MNLRAGEDGCARMQVIVSGRVQGVFFRQSTVDQARRLGITGWVRNLPSGEVEIMAEGRRRDLEALRSWAEQGPRHARVTGVREEWSQFANEFSDFRVR